MAAKITSIVNVLKKIKGLQVVEKIEPLSAKLVAIITRLDTAVQAISKYKAEVLRGTVDGPGSLNPGQEPKPDHTPGDAEGDRRGGGDRGPPDPGPEVATPRSPCAGGSWTRAICAWSSGVSDVQSAGSCAAWRPAEHAGEDSEGDEVRYQPRCANGVYREYIFPNQSSTWINTNVPCHPLDIAEHRISKGHAQNSFHDIAENWNENFMLSTALEIPRPQKRGRLLRIFMPT